MIVYQAILVEEEETEPESVLGTYDTKEKAVAAVEENWAEISEGIDLQEPIYDEHLKEDVYRTDSPYVYYVVKEVNVQ